MSTPFPNISLLSDGISPYPGALYGTEGIGITMETSTSSEDLYIKGCSSTYHKIATIAILLFFIVSLPGNTFVVWIYGQQVTKTSYAFYVLVIAITDMLFTVAVVPSTLFLRFSGINPFGNFNVQEVLYHSPKDACQVLTVFLLIFIAEERIKIFSDPFRPISKARMGLMRIGAVLLLIIMLFVPPFFLALHRKPQLTYFTRLIQPIVLIVAALVLLCLNIRVCLHASKAKKQRHELQKDIRAAKSRNKMTLTKNSSSCDLENDRFGGPSKQPLRLMSQTSRRLSSLEEDAKMVIALIVTSLVTCGFCLLKVQLIIKLILSRKYLIVTRTCWSHWLITDFLPHALTYMNYAMSPVVYYVISKRFREDVWKTIRAWNDCVICRKANLQTVVFVDSTRSTNTTKTASCTISAL